MDIVERFNDYADKHCWQYQIRLNNRETDLLEAGLTADEVNSLKISDFTFQFVPKEDKDTCKEIKAFIERHEWLGKMSLYPTHFFIARYNNIMAGVVIMDMPNAFSKLLGDNTKKIERLISRGACVSWSPKNTASSLIMFAIRWMVKNTQYRLFTAYSDPEAKELGTIYQACNFHYLGQTFGGNKQYKVKGKWVSDRYFRGRSIYKRLAVENGIIWNDGWVDKDVILFDKIEPNLASKIKSLSKDFMLGCEVRTVPKKHKYAYILGASKKETDKLRKEFANRHPKLYNNQYPKERGK